MLAKMAKNFLILFLVSLLSPFSLPALDGNQANESAVSTKIYIIQVQPTPASHTTQSWYSSFFIESSSTSPPIVYHYKSTISGFAARLSDAELEAMKEKPGFLSATADVIIPLATTHTPEFLGLLSSPAVNPRGLWKESDFGRGIIVAVLDSGVLPNHPSFKDNGMTPPPAKWKGKCEFSPSECNNKLIGARVFLQGGQALGKEILQATSPVDTDGHGTHTASTAVGNFVANASALGNAAGVAVGMAPNAHLAVYKVCTKSDCAGSDILAGIDAAIEEGADVLSLSLGGMSMMFDIDPLAVGTFAAVEKGLFVSLAAGNDGPGLSTLSNEAPWMLTVGASTIDRVIRVKVKLGSGAEFEGESLYQTESIAGKFLPLVYPGGTGNLDVKFCVNNSFNVDVKGKIVICDRKDGVSRINQGAVVKSAGGAGMILAAAKLDGYTTVADAHVIPAAHVSYPAATKIKSYINSTDSPTATIIPFGTLISPSKHPAPRIPSFSSRGPSLQSKGILKPDIIGPGVNVLAAWPALPIGPVNSSAIFNVISGTSMSTPHLSGIAALLKKANPSWSPAAIRSAIMTTASNENTVGLPIQDEQLKNANLFARGAGHVNPNRANNPGFVYDIKPVEYIAYMCGLNYSDAQVTAVARRFVKCSTLEPIYDVDLNYPSFSIGMRPGYCRKVSRRVKNVREGNSSYKVVVVPPSGVAMAVSPTFLSFSKSGEELTYTVEFKRDGRNSTLNYAEGYLVWVSSDKITNVRSPISITFTSK